jgi:hypothetical protein
MKKVMLTAAAFATAGASLVLAGSGSASSTGRTLELVGIQQQFLAPPAPHVGDRLLFKAAVYNRGPEFGKPAGARVGRATGVCTVTSDGRPPAVQCVYTAHVPDGQIVAMGEGDPGTRVNRWAIVGGIGAYANARGTLVITNVSETKSLVAVHLS